MMIETIILAEYGGAAILALGDKYDIISEVVRRKIGDIMVYGAIAMGYVSLIALIYSIFRLLKSIKIKNE